MLIVNAVILLLFVAMYILCLRAPKEWMKEVNKKEHKLYFLYPMADLFLSKTRLEEILLRKSKVTDSIKALYITNKPELIQKFYWYRKVSLIFAVLILFSLLSLLGQLETDSSSVLQKGRYITRPSYGEGSTEVELKVSMEKANDRKEQQSSKNPSSQELTIDVSEREYTKEEIRKLFDEATEFLRKDVLGNNESTEDIYESLNFIKTVPGTSISVEWKPSDYNLIHSDGSIGNEELVEGVRTEVTAVLSCQGQQSEVNMTVQIMPRKYSEEELLRRELEDKVLTSSERTEDKALLELPSTLDQYNLNWSGKEDSTGITLFFFGIFVAILIWYLGDKELKKQMKDRKNQMLLDYPEIINKFTLLVNAGMTVKQAWYKITEDYNAKYSQKHLKKRYAYEEMLSTAYELKLGLSESIAYEQYGRRIGMIPYIKFSSLITQNLKKGNKGFTDLLKQEAIEAFEGRKEMAKRLGEEAGTKLLMPMMLMLVIVFMIILIPAFMAFRL